jgi:hypothetical protein
MVFQGMSSESGKAYGGRHTRNSFMRETPPQDLSICVLAESPVCDSSNETTRPLLEA